MVPEEEGMPAKASPGRPSAVKSAIAVVASLLLVLSYILTHPRVGFRAFFSPSAAKEAVSWRDMNQFSLWAMPADGTAFQARSAAAIQSLSVKMKCTPFEPHVTVIGAFGADQGLDEQEVVARTRKLAQSLKPYDIKVQELSSGNIFFQCVYLKMVPSPEVMEVNRKARSVMGMDLNAAYMPHLSLIYGELSDDEKEQVKADFKASYQDLINDTAAFRVSSLVLYRTNPNDLSMASWERLGVFPLAS